MPRDEGQLAGDLRGDLRRRWQQLWRRFSLSRSNTPECEAILAAYESPGRHYHNLDHIHDCLLELDSAPQLAGDARLIELAIWFHDIVYDPKRHDNELLSAEFARAMLLDAGLPNSLIDAIATLILATRHAVPPIEPDAQLLVDIDLSILATSADRFDAYERAIRMEYHFVPDDAFRAGRADILQRFLERPHIYCTDFFRQRRESAARENLRRSIQHLAKGAAD